MVCIVKIKEITVNGRIYQAFEDDISTQANLVYIKGGKGFIMCGYLNLETAESKGNIAAVVTGVKTIADMLKTNIVEATSAAKAAGICVGMPVSQALEKIY